MPDDKEQSATEQPAEHEVISPISEVISPVVLQQVPLVLRGSLLSVSGEVPPGVLTETGEQPGLGAGVIETQVSGEKEDKDNVSPPVLET